MRTRTPPSSWYALATLSVAMLYALMDSQVLGLLAQAMKNDLQLSDTQLGSLRGVGAVLFSAIATLPLGWLADRVDRRMLLASCVLVWSAAIASCGLATGYWSLLASMAFLAAGEAGLQPVAYSLIPELFAERHRVVANFIYYAASVLASGVGFAIAGVVISHIGLVAQWFPDAATARQPWRLVFFAVGVPGPLLVIAIALIRARTRASPITKETAVSGARERPELLVYLGSHWKAVFGVYASVGVALLGFTAISTWLPVILTREFSQAAGSVGVGLGTAVGVGTVAGLLIAAGAAKLLNSRLGAATPLRMSQFGFLALAALMPMYLLARTSEHIIMIAGAQMAAFNGGNALMPSVIQNLAPASLRGRVFALSVMSLTVMQVTSPVVVGLLSDHVFTESGGLLLSVITLGTPCLLLAAVLFRLSERHILETMKGVNASSDAPERIRA